MTPADWRDLKSADQVVPFIQELHCQESEIQLAFYKALTTKHERPIDAATTVSKYVGVATMLKLSNGLPEFWQNILLLLLLHNEHVDACVRNLEIRQTFKSYRTGVVRCTHGVPITKPAYSLNAIDAADLAHTLDNDVQRWTARRAGPSAATHAFHNITEDDIDEDPPPQELASFELFAICLEDQGNLRNRRIAKALAVIPPAERKRLISERKCFFCQQMGHQVKDCPTI